jgi:SNF2 family DNA or RNA helicase
LNIKIEGKRVRTTSEYDARILRALNRLEGMKRWGSNRTFSFDNSAYNIEVWRSVFPDCKVETEDPAESDTEATSALFDVPGDRPTFQFKTPPRDHQKKALEKLKSLPAFGLFMDVGTGKSWTAIAFMGQRWCAGLSDHVLLIAKNGVHRQWVTEQIPEHMSEAVQWRAWIYGKSKKSEREFDELMAFDGLKIMAINIDAIATAGGEAKILAFLKQARGKATMIIDESQDIKNMTATRTKTAIKLGSLCRYRMIMTGTPIAKNVIDLFSQFKFLDENILGFRYITAFKNQYCIMRETPFGKIIAGSKNIEQLYRVIDPYIFRITSEEALDLPPKVYVRREFALSDAQLKAMKELQKQFFTDLGNGQISSVTTAATLLTRMQQISCGFLPTDDKTITRFPNPRMEELKTLIEQREGKIIIWCRFNQDIEFVMRELKQEAVDYYGKTPESQRKKNLDLFMDKDSRVRFLVASPEAAGTGLNLQGLCNTNIYYSNSFNALARWQSEGRTWRDGTKGTVTYFDLVAQKSPDKRILSNLRDKKSVSDMTLDDFRKLFAMEDEI